MIAIIPAAGMGTRFLPLTKAQPKEMLPVLDKPVIQHIVEEALDAGIDEVVIVNSHDKPSIERHFSNGDELAERLEASGKVDLARRVRHAGSLPVSFVYQEEALGLGHAVAQAASRIDGEPFLVMLGDALMTTPRLDERMIEISRKHGGANVIAVFEVPDEDVSRYGIVAGGEGEDGIFKVASLVEKPALEDAPSNLAIFGRYLLSPKVMELLIDAKPGVGGEIQLTDALVEALKTEEMYALEIDADEGYDTGTIESWFETNVKMAQKDAKYTKILNNIH